MEYKIESASDKIQVMLKGDVTFSENMAFREMLKELESKKVRSGVFDLSNVSMVDSAGLGMFLIAKEQADRAGWKLSVRGAHGHVASMFRLTKLAEILA